MSDVVVRALTGEAAEMAELQRVLEGAPDYAELLTGSPPGPADAQSLFTVLPEGKGYEDKFVFGLFEDARMVGCADLIRGWPDAHTAQVGLLLIDEAHQGQGLGTRAWYAIERVVATWPECARIRLGILRDNHRAHRFWSARGFEPTGEVRPHRYATVESEIVVYVARRSTELDASSGLSSIAHPSR